MSLNNQILVKEYKGKWYVFECMAESWSVKNELSIKDAIGCYKTFRGATIRGIKLMSKTEYGVDTFLIKDGADVTLII